MPDEQNNAPAGPPSMTPPEAPKTKLGNMRILAPNCGLRVSPLQLGAMSIGEAWAGAMGSQNRENSEKLLDAFVEAGGNMIDTANNYQEGESEEWIGEWMKKRGIRDELVIATKYTTMYRGDVKQGRANYMGNHRKSLMLSVDASLKKLQTSYIDILYLHWWDWTTSIEEVMLGLADVVRSGKVLYLGISDTPAWIVSAANTYARQHALPTFVIYQGRFNIMLRDFERDIIPMARHFGMALAPWDAMGGGKFQTKEDMEKRNQSGEGLRKFTGPNQTEKEVKISEALDKIGKELGGKRPTAVALAYVMAKAPHVFPIVGGRKVEHLHDNIGALDIHFTQKQLEELEAVTEFELGFPGNFVGTQQGQMFLLGAAGPTDWEQPSPVSHTAPTQ